jgi:hypothetical protein
MLTINLKRFHPIVCKAIKRKVEKRDHKYDLLVRIDQCYLKHTLTFTFIIIFEIYLHFLRQILLPSLIPSLPFLLPKSSQNNPGVHFKKFT